MAWFVYMLRCGDGSLYTGSTNDLERRLTRHQRGRGAKYTRSRLPVTLAYWEEVPDRSCALRREAAVKRLTRGEKLALIAKKERENPMEVRRHDRQITEEEAWQVVDACEYAFLAMTAEDGAPYGLPLTIAREGRAVYFHSAMAGRKTESLRRRPQVCLTCVGDTQILPEEYTTLYESAVAFGQAAEVTDEAEKIHALDLICRRHTPENMAGFDNAVARSLSRTAIWKITIESITGKAKRPKKG